MQEWRYDEASGGLYRLHLDGEATPVTALVDRGASRSEQLEQLAQAQWVPEHQLARYFEAIVAGVETSTTFLPLPPDRLYAPLSGLSTVVDLAADEDVRHPLRRYLWPVLDPAGQLLLDPGEEIMASLPVGQPRYSVAGSVEETKLGREILVAYTEECRLILTNCRIVVQGRIVEPDRVREDYKGKKSLALGLLSPGVLAPGFDDLLARRRAKKRQRNVEDLRPAMQFRLEFLAGVVKETKTIQAPKPRFVSKRPPRMEVAFQVHISLSGERFARLEFEVGKNDSIEGSGFVDSLLRAARESDLGLVVRAPETERAEIPPSRWVESGDRTVEIWRIDGGLPFSIPAKVARSAAAETPNAPG